MFKIRLKATILFAIILSFSSSAYALRCDNRIISRGYFTAQVERLCGPPAQKIDCTVDRRLENDRGQIEIIRGQRCERWVYNFGPKRLEAILTFIEGQLDSETSSGSYGY